MSFYGTKLGYIIKKADQKLHAPSRVKHSINVSNFDSPGSRWNNYILYLSILLSIMAMFHEIVFTKRKLLLSVFKRKM